MAKTKQLSKQGILGQKGINLIERILLNMGSRWTQSGPNEVGLDGYIELFDPSSGEALGKSLAVQSKAVSHLQGETERHFEFPCRRRDIDYWLQGNMPVILIVSRPDSGEAYWISIKEYFGTLGSDRRSKIRFDKVANRFSHDTFEALLTLSRSKQDGLYLAPQPRTEQLVSNLLHLKEYPPRIWAGQTALKSPGEVWSQLRNAQRHVHGSWFLRSKSIVSFTDLGERPWLEVCDLGTVEEFDTKEWSESDDPVRLREFVELLNRTLGSQLYPDVRYWPREECFAMSGDLDAGTRRRSYRSLKRTSKIAVVTRYEREVADGSHFEWLRHLAFRGRFRRFDDRWFIEITPTYRFTRDGFELDRFHEGRLRGIKQLEGNRAVLSAVVFWADHLRSAAELFDMPALGFGNLETFQSDVGIDDGVWSAQGDLADEENLQTEDQLSLLSGLEEEARL